LPKGGVITSLESAVSLIPFASSVEGRGASLLRPHFPHELTSQHLLKLRRSTEPKHLL
jgi:hypothetical protein